MQDADGEVFSTGSDLRLAHVVLWVAAASAVLAVIGAAASRERVFLVGFLIAWIGGSMAIRDVARARNINGVVTLLSFFMAFMPLIQLAPLIYFLKLARTAVAQTGSASNGRAAREAHKRARERAAARETSASTAPTRAEPAKASAVGDNRAKGSARTLRAIACIKQVVAMPASSDGNRLRVRVSHPGVAESEDDQPVVRATQGLFAVFYLVDEGRHYAYVNSRDLQEANLSVDALHQVGLQNLAALVNSAPGLSLRNQGDYSGLVMGGQFEASLLLLDELWDQTLKSQYHQDVVVTVPARDICAFCDAGSATGVAQLRQIAARVTSAGDHLLSPLLLIRRSGRWQAMEGA
ncbi:DUF1444 family protein [Variovorax gossypii]